MNEYIHFGGMMMKKRTLAGLSALILCLMLALPASAANRFAFRDRSITLAEGESFTAELLREGSYSGEGEITYASGKPNVAVVDASGVITAVSKGQTTVSATLRRNGKRVGQANMTVQVTRPVTKVTLNTQKLNVYEPDDPAVVDLLREPVEERILAVPAGTTVSLTAVCTPENASNRRVTFTSSDAGVVRISNNQSLRALQQGECTLTIASVSDPEVTETWHVLVTQPVKKITVTAGSRNVAAGSTLALQAVCSPDNASIKTVTWSSRQPAVATVDADGVVTGLKKGTVVITATAADGSNAKGSVTINVTQPVTTLQMKQDVITVDTGRSRQAQVNVLPASASDKGLSWESSDEGVATVENGRITGRKAGECFVTCASRSNPEVSAEIRVVVSQPVTKVEILNRKEELNIRVGESVQLAWNLLPEDVSNPAVTFRSNHAKIAAVDAGGLVTGISRGTATIFVTAADGSKKQAGVKINVIQPVTGVSMQQPLYYVQRGGTATVKASVEPRNASNQKVYWSSEDEWICAVSSAGTSTGRVQGLTAGTSLITAMTEDGGYTASAMVRVGNFNEAVMVEDLRVSGGNLLQIVLRNMSSDLELDTIWFRVECFDESGAPMVCNTDNTSTFFEGSYAWRLDPLARSTDAGFRFQNDMISQPLGAVVLTVVGWRDANGITWNIPESEQLPRQWNSLFPVG